MVEKIDTRQMSHDEWLSTRSKYIGGSDAGAIAGLNPWKSLLSIYLEKTGQKELVSKDNERMRIGRDLEDYVAKRFEEATGKKVRRNNFMMIKEDFMSANVDREVVGENAVLECKTTNSYAKDDWEEDSIPVHYELQCHHYMMVGGYDKAYIAVLIGNEKFVYKEIPRDEDVIKMLYELEKNFWTENVLKKQLPEADGSDSYSEELRQKYKGGIEDSIDLLIDEERLTRLEELKKMEKEIKSQIKKIEQEIQVEMGDYEVATTDSYKFTWKTQTRTSIDTKKLREENPNIYDKYLKISTFRTFRTNKIK
ncbi:YqaJ viral recombinase family nuclease [Helcococcus sueciensis]|uniref:YqaJ viral recombinase family nuclease n=1 Tax=Helcococcus sueciensis TaxID=241555 RepID=UPI00040EB76F|nr:YqaJ viral recombinase family protein [Helcococcus sueciensis]